MTGTREAAMGPMRSVDAAKDCFQRGGYARSDYHKSPLWKESYERLQAVSRPFFALAWQNGAEGYDWPLDPLHYWSRVWEYPFVAEQLRRHAGENHGLRLLDIGAAVTFFSFYLMRQGFEVTNLDFDPQMPAFFERAFRRASKELGVEAPPRYLTADARDTKLPDESFDIVTCVSVLEHIPGWERALREIHRLLRPGGLLILTFDVQHSGPADALSMADSGRLLQQLSDSMDALTRIEDAIPADALTPFNGTFRPRVTRVRSRFRQLWPITTLPRRFVDRLRRKPRAEDICVFGGVWRKRSIG